MLTALQWGLFGDGALPGGLSNYRLSSLDCSENGSENVDVSVETDFTINQSGRDREYRLITHATERVEGASWNRDPARFSLYELTTKGAEEVTHPESHLRPHLPSELREVFFTDGDRALSFIEGTRSEQSKRVEGAIRSLLGLEIMESAIKHISQVRRNLNQQIASDSADIEEVETLSKRIASFEEKIPVLEEKIKKARAERLKLEELERDRDRKISEALKKGNRKELERQRKEAERLRIAKEKEAEEAAKAQSQLFKSKKLGQQLLADKLKRASVILDKLRNQGKLPNQTIPVLEDILKQDVCICGEDISAGNPDSEKRRQAIKDLISASRDSDAIQKKLTDLYYESKQQGLIDAFSEQPWHEEYSALFSKKQAALRKAIEHGEKYREIDHKISEIPNVDIQQFIQTRDQYKYQAKKAHKDEISSASLFKSTKERLKEYIDERQKLLQKNERGMQINSEFEVANDVQDALEAALSLIKTEELTKVSSQMNSLFLDMIGADPNQSSIIREASITPDFRIAVHGRNDQPLDPSQDLNGASRRALTISFILALTNVSEVEAPNVIDTPLGMMSGYVKRSVLNLAARHSSQLILFLTPAEIADCEDILDAKAGSVCTITNPAHYPRILVNDPGVKEAKVLMCNCNHRQECQLCMRRKDSVTTEH